MSNVVRYFLVALVSLFPLTTIADSEEESLMQATGTFDVNLEAKDDGEFSAGRMLISKSYSGDLEGNAVGQMISVRTGSGHAAYYAVEEFSGKLGEKRGTFILLHEGVMSPQEQSLSVKVLKGSGTEALQALEGTLTITQTDAGHEYTFEYSL
jgi:hypothetical protein